MLISCPECQHQISDKAEQCPNCGFPIKTLKKYKCELCGSITENENSVCDKCAKDYEINCSQEEVIDDKFSFKPFFMAGIFIGLVIVFVTYANESVMDIFGKMVTAIMSFVLLYWWFIILILLLAILIVLIKNKKN